MSQDEGGSSGLLTKTLLLSLVICHFVHCCCCWSCTLFAIRHVLVCLCMVNFPRFFSGIFLGCDSGSCSRNSICHSCWSCFRHWTCTNCCAVVPLKLIYSACSGTSGSSCSGRKQQLCHHRPLHRSCCPRRQPPLFTWFWNRLPSACLSPLGTCRPT